MICSQHFLLPIEKHLDKETRPRIFGN